MVLNTAIYGIFSWRIAGIEKKSCLATLSCFETAPLIAVKLEVFSLLPRLQELSHLRLKVICCFCFFAFSSASSATLVTFPWRNRSCSVVCVLQEIVCVLLGAVYFFLEIIKNAPRESSRRLLIATALDSCSPVFGS